MPGQYSEALLKRRLEPRGTSIRVGASGATFDADFEVRLVVVPQKPHKISEKLMFSIQANCRFVSEKMKVGNRLKRVLEKFRGKSDANFEKQLRKP